ncbi:MAG: hypothetical protein ACWGPR_08540 [Candidatus Deferrimicrobiaceae bacterium]
MELTEEQLAQLREQHGETEELRMGEQTVVVRAPTELEYFTCIDTMAHDKKSKARAMKALALSCVVFPDREAAIKLMGPKPARYSKAFEVAMKLAGDEDEDEGEGKKGSAGGAP